MDYITTTQASKILNVSVTRILVFIQEDRLAAKKFGRAWLIRKSDLEKFAKIPRRPGRKKGFSPKKSAK